MSSDEEGRRASTWEERMAAKHRARMMRGVEERRRAYLGEAFLRFYPDDDEEHLRWGFEPQVEIMPEIIAANCLGITYGDPGPPLESNWCRQCWGERHVWLGNCWGLQHAGGTLSGCQHGCHAGEVWMGSAGVLGADQFPNGYLE
jgi:hypothetical protein